MTPITLYLLPAPLINPDIGMNMLLSIWNRQTENTGTLPVAFAFTVPHLIPSAHFCFRHSSGGLCCHADIVPPKSNLHSSQGLFASELSQEPAALTNYTSRAYNCKMRGVGGYNVSGNLQLRGIGASGKISPASCQLEWKFWKSFFLLCRGPIWTEPLLPAAGIFIMQLAFHPFPSSPPNPFWDLWHYLSKKLPVFKLCFQGCPS